MSSVNNIKLWDNDDFAFDGGDGERVAVPLSTSQQSLHRPQAQPNPRKIESYPAPTPTNTTSSG